MYYIILFLLCSLCIRDTFSAFQESNEIEDNNEIWLETTISPDSGNVTLDIIPKANSTEDKAWNLPRSTSRHFEYYNTTEELKLAAQNETSTSCAHDMGQHAAKLSDSDGTWVACRSFLEGCEAVHDCIPAMNYSGGTFTNPLHTVGIKLALTGSAIARLSIGSSSTCFDFTHIKDPFSKCTFMNHTTIIPIEGWSYVQSNISAYENLWFTSFSLQLIARFKGDVVLVDKIEANTLILCGNVTCQVTTAQTPSTVNTTTTATSSTTPTTTTTEDECPDPEACLTTAPIRQGTTINPNVATSTTISNVCTLLLIFMLFVFN